MDILHLPYIPLALWSAIWNHLPTDLHGLGVLFAPPDLLGVLHGWQDHGPTHWLQLYVSGPLEGWGDGFGALLAQAGRPQQFDQNILADLSRAWNNFIRSGQAAALGIGLFVGYMFRVFTSSG